MCEPCQPARPAPAPANARWTPPAHRETIDPTAGRRVVGRRSDIARWAKGATMQRPKPVLLVVLLAGAAALSAPGSAGAASGPQTFTGTIITDAAGGERHMVKSIVVAHGAFNGIGTIVEVPNQPGDGEDIFRDDLVFPQGTLHLVTTNLDSAFKLIPQSCRFTASVQQT